MTRFLGSTRIRCILLYSDVFPAYFECILTCISDDMYSALAQMRISRIFLRNLGVFAKTDFAKFRSKSEGSRKKNARNLGVSVVKPPHPEPSSFPAGRPIS